ncbi:5090_t:CDS:2, partial [Dentiscutata heterogama]
WKSKQIRVEKDEVIEAKNEYEALICHQELVKTNYEIHNSNRNHYEKGNGVEVKKKVEVDLQIPVEVDHTGENNEIRVKRDNYKAENKESAENERLKRFTDNDALNYACEIWIKK